MDYTSQDCITESKRFQEGITDMIYADNAATTKMSRIAIDAMLPYMEEIWGNPSSLYVAGQKAAEALWSARERIAA